MKRISILATFCAAILAVSCAEDIMTPDQSKLPKASELTPVITVNQETNQVTFSIKDAGVVPIWIFGEEKIDGKASKKYSYTQNGITLRIREEGDHTVELKAYNGNGISQGSQLVTFHLDNTYRDPFDATPYMKAVSNTWAWDSATAGHFGCGQFPNNPTEWWSCNPNGKDGFGLYDDILTFDVDGNFTFDPGAAGTVYVNWASGFKPEGHDDEIAAETDYQVPVEATTTKYSIENNWNDAGIEEIYLVLETGQWLSYIPNANAIAGNERYMFIETATSSIKKNMQLVNYNGQIAWKYSFVPYVKEATVEELLAGTDGNGKVWIMDAGTVGHLGCGSSIENPTEWWAAPAYDKADFGLYDDELTFYPDGKYSFSPGEDGNVYVNTGVKSVGAEYNQGSDFDMPWDAFETTYEFDGEKIVLPEGKIIGYIPNDEALGENSTYYVTNITETSLTLVWYTPTGNGGGSIAWQYKFKARDYKEPDSSIGGVEFTNGAAELSISNGQALTVTGIDLSKTWIDPDFFEQTSDNTLSFLAVSGDYRIYKNENWLKVIPLSDGEPATWDNGGALWFIGEGAGKPAGSAPGWVTGPTADIPMAKIGDNLYQATLYCTANTNVKLFGQADWGKEFKNENYSSMNGNGYIQNSTERGSGDDGNLYAASGLEEGWYVFTVKVEDDMLDLTVDKKRDTYYDIEGETNLWRSTNVTVDFWYADGGWTQIGNPDFEWIDETKKDCK